MDIANYHNIVKTVLKDFEYPDFQWVYKRPSIAELYKPDKRCGIYVLRFQNNQYYVGQAVDVIRRYVQHSKVHEDIQEILGIYDLKQDFKEEKYFNLSNHIIQSILNIRNERTKLNPVSSPKAQFRINLKL